MSNNVSDYVSDYVKNNFLPSDQDAASRELDCYNYCMTMAIEYVAINRFDKASAFHENAARSLQELEKLKNAKSQADLILNQIKAEKDQKILLSKMVKQNE